MTSCDTFNLTYKVETSVSKDRTRKSAGPADAVTGVHHTDSFRPAKLRVVDSKPSGQRGFLQSPMRMSLEWAI